MFINLMVSNIIMVLASWFVALGSESIVPKVRSTYPNFSPAVLITENGPTLETIFKSNIWFYEYEESDGAVGGLLLLRLSKRWLILRLRKCLTVM